MNKKESDLNVQDTEYNYDMKRINVFNYYPLEFLGGGEYVAIDVFNYLNSYYKIKYTSAINFEGLTRDTIENISKKISFEYNKSYFIYYSKFSKILNRPFPRLNDLADSNITLIFLDRPVPRRFLMGLERLNKKVVFLLHGITFESLRVKSLSQLRVTLFMIYTKAYFWANKRHYRNPNFYYQVLNDSQSEFLLHLGVKKGKIFKIPNGVDFNNYYIKRNDEKFKIIFMGRLEKTTKGIDFLKNIIISTEKRFKDRENALEFVILGSGKDSGLVKELADRFSNVKYLGFVDDSNKYFQLSTSNLMLVTSNMEPFSVTILEGLASGVPVLTANASGPREIVSQCSEFGEILDYNVYNFISKILLYFDLWNNDKENYYRKRLKIRECALNMFDKRLMLEAYRKLIEDISGGTK